MPCSGTRRHSGEEPRIELSTSWLQVNLLHLLRLSRPHVSGKAVRLGSTVHRQQMWPEVTRCDGARWSPASGDMKTQNGLVVVVDFFRPCCFGVIFGVRWHAVSVAGGQPMLHRKWIRIIMTVIKYWISTLKPRLMAGTWRQAPGGRAMNRLLEEAQGVGRHRPLLICDPLGVSF